MTLVGRQKLHQDQHLSAFAGIRGNRVAASCPLTIRYPGLADAVLGIVFDVGRTSAACGKWPSIGTARGRFELERLFPVVDQVRGSRSRFPSGDNAIAADASIGLRHFRANHLPIEKQSTPRRSATEPHTVPQRRKDGTGADPNIDVGAGRIRSLMVGRAIFLRIEFSYYTVSKLIEKYYEMLLACPIPLCLFPLQSSINRHVSSAPGTWHLA